MKMENYYLFEQELEFSKSLSSPMICPDDMDDSSCLAKHCSVLKMSLLWHPYSFLRMIGKDSAKLTLNTTKLIFMTFYICRIYHLLTSTIASSVCPSLFFTCNILWVTCLYLRIFWWNISGVCIFPPVCLPIHQKFPQSIIFGIFGKFH